VVLTRRVSFDIVPAMQCTAPAMPERDAQRASRSGRSGSAVQEATERVPPVIGGTLLRSVARSLDTLVVGVLVALLMTGSQRAAA
jgi:hypothetical protein